MNKQNMRKIEKVFSRRRFWQGVLGVLFGLILQVTSLLPCRAAETTENPTKEGWEVLFPENGYNTLVYTYNQLSVIDMLLANRENAGMAPIYNILDHEDFSIASFHSLLGDLSGSVRFNGMRMSMSSPW